MNNYDWSRPQRQPWAGLMIVLLSTLGELFKRYWIFVILLFIQRSPTLRWYEVLGFGVLVFSIVDSLMAFLFFRFQLEENNLIIRKGWIIKQTLVIPLEKIQTVNMEQGPLHKLLSMVKLSIDTAGAQDNEAKFHALHQTMALSLKELLLSKSSGAAPKTAEPPLLQLGISDLVKLSVSANHVETLFIILTFVFGVFENVEQIHSGLFSGLDTVFEQHTIFLVLLLIIIGLFLTILVSTARIFFRFYDFRVVRSDKGFSIRSGLTNVKERLVSYQKIQYLSWKANWIRKLMGLWMFEFHTALSDDIKNKEKVQLPLTRPGFISTLAAVYHPEPSTKDIPAIRMHPSFVWRMTLLAGILPSVVIIGIGWNYQGLQVFWSLLLPLLVLILAFCARLKFRLWAFDEVAYIRRGFFGVSYTLVRWEKLQSIQLNQSIFQRRKGLASLVLQTAAGKITFNYLPLEAAREVMNFALYKAESNVII